MVCLPPLDVSFAGALSALSFIAAGLLSAAAAVSPALRKRLLMTDTPTAPAAAPAAIVAEAANDAPIATAPTEAAEASSPAIDSAAVVSSVIQTVQAHPAIPAEHAASVITALLAGLYQASPAIFAVSRASTKTQTEVGLGFGLAQIILGAFLHPQG